MSIQVSRESQFAMLHDIAKVVYKKQQSTLLSEMATVTDTRESHQEDSTVHVTCTPNLLAPLLRMCGSQLQRIYALKPKELNKKQLSAAVATKISEEVAFVEYLTMGTEQKKAFSESLPASDRGKMRFPIPEVHPFLTIFDRTLSERLNYESFKQHGKTLFQVS